MGTLTEVTVAAIFHHFAEFLRKTGDLGIFDTLVHNYRLKESLSLTEAKLEDFSRDLLQLIDTVQNLLNPSNKGQSEIHAGSTILFNHSVVENGNGASSEAIRPAAGNSIEINWTGSIRQSGQKKRRTTIKAKGIKEREVPAPALAVVVPDRDDVEGIFCCRACSRFYKSKNSYLSHACPKNKQVTHYESDAQLTSDTSEMEKLKRFVCGICLQAMQTYDRIVFHLAKCEGGPYTCEFCDSSRVSKKVTFESLKDLNHHKRTEHPHTKCFVCNECGSSFQRKQSLAKHKRVRHEKHSFPCPSCDQVFDRRINLTNHKIKHHEEMKRCSQCGIGCSSDAALSTHIALKHNSETAAVAIKKFTCSLCQKEFPRKDKLEFHLSTHTGQKPFICATCGKAFSRKFKLEDHEARHLGIKKYLCTYPGCSKAYASNADLKIHCMKQHPAEGVPSVPQPSLERKRNKRKAQPFTAAIPSVSVAEILLLEVNSADFQSVEAPMEGLSQGISPFPVFSEEIIERLPPIALETETQSFTTGEVDYGYPADSYFISDSVPNLPLTSTDQYSITIESDQGLQFMSESNPFSQNFYGMENNDNGNYSVNNTLNSEQYQNQYPYQGDPQQFNATMGNDYPTENVDRGSSSNQGHNFNMLPQYDYIYHRKSLSSSSQANYAQDFHGSTLGTQFQSFQNQFQEPLGRDTGLESVDFSVDHGSHRMPPQNVSTTDT